MTSPSQANERDPSEPSVSISAWVLIWTIYVAKLGTIVLIFWASHAFDTALLVAATTWLWLGPALVLAVSPLAFRYRLRRVRRRRDALQRAEWLVGPTAAPGFDGRSR